MAWHDARWGGGAPLAMGLAGKEKCLQTYMHVLLLAFLEGVIKALLQSPLLPPPRRRCRPWGASICSARRKEALKPHRKQSLCSLPICCPGAAALGGGGETGPPSI